MRTGPIPPPAAVLAALAALDDGAGEPVVVRDGPRMIVASRPDEVVVASGAAALDALAGLTPGWWAGYLAYDLGRVIEPVVPRFAVRSIPDLALARYSSRLVLDPARGAWVEGEGPTRPDLERAAERALDAPGSGPTPPALGPWRSSLDAEEYAARVGAVIALLEAGECYQVNLTRRLTCDRPADPLALFAALESANPSPYGSLVRGGGVTVVSASPERFLRWQAGTVETRPIKGTAGATAGAPTQLARSAKDRAENVMIVDLARNDLGRVCEPGSITVPELCGIESHPGLHHLVSTVRGRLRDEHDVAGLLRATFPPASVTGAPKPRVLQAIEDLEPVPRGIYCGAVGWIDTQGHAGDLAVAIRTFTITDRETSLGVGAGIVADSRAAAEWAETELKAARLLRAAGAATPRLAGAGR